MIETKEQYEELRGAISYVAAGHYQDEEIAGWLERQVETIEALREVARGANQQRWISVTHPQLWNEELGDALDALPNWLKGE